MTLSYGELKQEILPLLSIYIDLLKLNLFERLFTLQCEPYIYFCLLLCGWPEEISGTGFSPNSCGPLCVRSVLRRHGTVPGHPAPLPARGTAPHRYDFHISVAFLSQIRFVVFPVFQRQQFRDGLVAFMRWPSAWSCCQTLSDVSIQTTSSRTCSCRSTLTFSRAAPETSRSPQTLLQLWSWRWRCSRSLSSQRWFMWLFSLLTLSWSSSRAWCQSHGADLVIINTTTVPTKLLHRRGKQTGERELKVESLFSNFPSLPVLDSRQPISEPLHKPRPQHLQTQSTGEGRSSTVQIEHGWIQRGKGS